MAKKTLRRRILRRGLMLGYDLGVAVLAMLVLRFMYFTVPGLSIFTLVGLGKVLLGIVPVTIVTMVALMVAALVLRLVVAWLVDWSNYNAHMLFDALEGLEDVLDLDKRPMMYMIPSTIIGIALTMILVGWICPADLTVTSWFAALLWPAVIVLFAALSDVLRNALFKEVKIFSVTYTGDLAGLDLSSGALFALVSDATNPEKVSRFLMVQFETDEGFVLNKKDELVRLGLTELTEGRVGFEVTCLDEIDLLKKLPKTYRGLTRSEPIEKEAPATAAAA